jgi:hypothetical protein
MSMMPTNQVAGPSDTSAEPARGGMPVAPAQLDDFAEPVETWPGLEMEWPPGQAAPPSFAWYQAWYRALAHPRVATYRELIADPRSRLWKGILWLAIPYALEAVLLLGFAPALAQPYRQMGMGELPATAYDILVRARQGLLADLALLAFAQFVARAILRRQGRFQDLVYVYAAFAAPLGIIAILGTYMTVALVGAALVSPTDPVDMILLTSTSIVPLAYGAFLTLVALRAVYQQGWVRAIANLVLAVAITFGLEFFWALAAG